MVWVCHTLVIFTLLSLSAPYTLSFKIYPIADPPLPPLKKQQVEVEVMRESVQLQAQAARRVLAKRESIISELGDGIAIATEEVVPPPLTECELKEPVLRA